MMVRLKVARAGRDRRTETVVQEAPNGQLVIDEPPVCDWCHRLLGQRSARPWTLFCRYCKAFTERAA